MASELCPPGSWCREFPAGCVEGLLTCWHCPAVWLLSKNTHGCFTGLFVALPEVETRRGKGYSPGCFLSLSLNVSDQFTYLERLLQSWKKKKLGGARRIQRLKKLFHNDAQNKFSLFTLCKRPHDALLGGEREFLRADQHAKSQKKPQSTSLTS